MGERYTVTTRCTFCGQCQVECPVAAMGMSARGAVIDQGRCVGCGNCYRNCASQAIDALAADAAEGSVP